jgi:Serine hydrolase (FSH1)
VLCIHGYRQNAEGFKGKIGSFRKIFKNKNVEFVFLNAPHDVPPDPNINTEGKNYHKMWVWEKIIFNGILIFRGC